MEDIITRDAHDNILQDGDTIFAIKDLKVKGGKTIKRGEKFKIRLTNEEGIVDAGKLLLETVNFKKQ